MQGGGQATAPLRAGKKMRKRRELDALAPGGRRLLAGSSDEREESWGWAANGLGATAAAGAGAACRRSRPRRSCAPAARACAALLLCACATATATVVWLFVDVREQMSALRSEMELVSIGSQGDRDALQTCHSTVRELRHNHTEMVARLDRIVSHTDNLTMQVAALQSGLLGVQQRVASAPELVDVPQQLSSLGTSVAGLGSQIKDFDSTVVALRTQSTVFTKNLSLLRDDVDDLKNRSFYVNGSDKKELLSLSKQQSELRISVSQLSTNVSSINETLATKIDWATQDFQNDHHKVAQLLESVQNNSAALSSLQAAWRQSNDIIAHNITELHRKIADKSNEIQRQISELHTLIKELEATESKNIANINKARETKSNSIPADVAAANDDPSSDILNIPIEKSETVFNMPRVLIGSTLPPPLPIITKASSVLPRLASGKPNILTSGGA